MDKMTRDPIAPWCGPAFLSENIVFFSLKEINLFFTYLTKKWHQKIWHFLVTALISNLQWNAEEIEERTNIILGNLKVWRRGGGVVTIKKEDNFHSPVVVVAWLRNRVVHLRGLLLLIGRTRVHRSAISWIISICQNDTEKSKKGQEFHVFFLSLERDLERQSRWGRNASVGVCVYSAGN